MTKEPYEYELLAIDWVLNYEFGEETAPTMVRDDTGDEISSQEKNLQIQYDANGIPMGQSLEEIKIRENLIQQFWNEWKAAHADQKVFNEKLGENILLRSVSVIEAKEHSAKSYQSTSAFLQLDEVLAKAAPVGRTPSKHGNSNQSEFVAMLIMVYRNELWGRVKITVGIRRKPNKEGIQEKVQYGMSVLEPGQPLMPPTTTDKNKKKKAHR